MTKLKTFIHSRWFPLAALFLISALVYLPKISQFSYYRDDWYYMYDGHIAGPSIFNEMFQADRPARGLFFGLYFSLFQTDPFPYAVGAYFWRVASAIGAHWLLSLLFPNRTKNNLFMAILVLIYPGYLWWVAGIEYQPMIASFCLQVFSIALSLKSLTSEDKSVKIMHALLAIVTGWLYLLLVDYAIGMEVFRFICIYILSSRNSLDTIFKRIKNSLHAGWWNLLIPLGYLSWRIFFFNSERKATDIGLQMGQLFSSPLTGAWWFIRGVQSFLNVSLLAWTEPFNRSFFELRLQEMMIGLTLASFTVGIFLIINFLHSLPVHNPNEEISADARIWVKEGLLIGYVGVLAGILPVIIANRYITFDRFSHYALPASLPASILIAVVILKIPSERFRAGIFSLVLFLATLTHYSIATQAVNEERAIQDFWWQVTWRAPNIRENTSLMVNYPSIEYGEDYEIVSGPANFIYYDEQLPPNGLVRYPISAISMTSEGFNNILAGKLSAERIVRSHTFLLDYGNILVMSQPSASSCVHVVDATWREVSVSELNGISLSSPQSKINNVEVNVPGHIPPASLFGSEPEHDWCFYYQKATLARQLEDWVQIADLGKQAAKAELHPNDQIELMPFLQSAAMLGDEKTVKQISTRVNTELLYKQQACFNLNAMDLTPEMQSYTSDLFCSTTLNQ
ncbi:MAG: hypothetical protein K8S20_13860 [Chloroflexi bacterium]|nr:hypothetical protein [Chloroflexota bacterium]